LRQTARPCIPRTPEETKDPRGPELRLRPPVPDNLSLDDMRRLSAFPEDLVALAQASGSRSLSYTYSEPIAFFEYTYDTCKLARATGVKNVLVTSGSIEERPLRDLAQFVDAAHVDLKGFDESTYLTLNSGRVTTILNTIKTLRAMGVWFEAINLVVPTYTDNLDAIARMCDWLVKSAGPDVPLHFSRFHPQHPASRTCRRRRPPRCRATHAAAKAAGLRYPYIGNVAGLPEAETTYCPGGRQPVVERRPFAVTALRLAGNKCARCQTPGLLGRPRCRSRRRAHGKLTKEREPDSADTIHHAPR